MADDNTGLTGKKVFFLHPSVFVQNEVIAGLAQQEYEVYAAREESKLQRVLGKYPDSVVFASIDEVLGADKWEAWIRTVMENAVTKTVSIGILSSANTAAARQLYLDVLHVPCGFLSLKSDVSKLMTALLEVLRAAEAKGRRKYIRADTRGETMTTVNLSLKDGRYITGDIRDISVVGFSCVFSEFVELAKNSLFSDMQIKLQSALIKAEGIVFGSRMENNNKVYVFVFTYKVDFTVKAKIRAYIQKNLQAKMDAELK
ncbi:MAG: PilZ domain-containing protein [Treponema sp.]|jgi:hypothetical protein|nr:PilZ domain-containing protein [Treponema sp.]